MNSSFCRSSAGTVLMQLEHNYCSVRMVGWPLFLKNKRIEKYPAAKSQEEKILMYLIHFHQGGVCHISKVSCERKIIKKNNFKWRWNRQKCWVWIWFNAFKLQLIRNLEYWGSWLIWAEIRHCPYPIHLNCIISRSENHLKNLSSKDKKGLCF